MYKFRYIMIYISQDKTNIVVEGSISTLGAHIYAYMYVMVWGGGGSSVMVAL